MKEVDVEVLRATGLDDYRACVELQKVVWSLTTTEDMTSHLASAAILSIADRYGGMVLVAREQGNRSGDLAGFAFAMLARESGDLNAAPIWWSHMTAVAPRYQNRNIGLLLKLRQREEALRQGIEQIHWTFDPLQSLNGYFNMHKLGAIARHYENDVYGRTTSALHHGLPTDRFIAEWHLNSTRVRDCISGHGADRVPEELDRISLINPRDGEPRMDLADERLLLEIPSDLRTETAPEAWQSVLRAVCARYFSLGYTVTDFFRSDGRSFYLLSRIT